MTRIEDDIISLMALIVMFITVLVIHTTTDAFKLFSMSIAFTFTFIIFYITRRIVYIEVKKEDPNGKTERNTTS